MKAHTTMSIQISFFILALIFVAAYTLFEASTLLQGPRISVAEPNTATQDRALVTISGDTTNVTWLALLGKQIHMNEEGIFREEILVPVGYSVFTIEARDRFGRTTTEKIEIVRAEPPDLQEVLTTASTSPTIPS